MANIRNCSYLSSCILIRGRILFPVLAVLALGVYGNAQTVVRTNGGTETATGTDVSTVQKADGWASGDVISVSGTSATSIAPFSSSVRVESSSNYTVTDFTVQSATGDKQYIGALPNSRNYVLKLGNKNYNLTFKNVEFQNNDIPQDTAGIFLIMDQATSTVTLNLDNASFTKFKGSKDGNYGGIINSSGDLTINGTNTVSFYGNGTGSGGAIFANKAVTINCDEMIFDNNACNNSGAIRNSGALDIKGSKVTFTNNSARNNGGGIYSTSTVKMTGKGDNSILTFTGNTAANEGGVIYSTGTGIDLDFDTINFSNNTATNFGGAIRFNNTNTNYKLTITGETVTFDNNSALNKNGGAIHTNASVVLKGKSENSVFTITNNTAPKGNSGFIVAVGSVEISTGSFLFQNNTASGIAGAIEARKGITFSGDSTSATFTGNYAGENGSDLYLSNANSVLTFQDAGTYYFDGGIYLSDASQSVVIDKAQVTIAGRAGVTNNNYQLQTVHISNGGKLTVNLDYLDSLTGTINVGTDESEGTLEFGVGEGLSATLPNTFGISFADKGVLSKSGSGTLKLPADFTYNGETNVSDGTLEVSKDFTPSALTGSGTLKLSGASKFFDVGDASGFTGTVQVFDENISGNSRINLAGNNGTESTNIDLSNATLELNGNPSGKYSELAFYKGSSSLSIGTLNGNKYGRILNVDSSSDAAYNDLIVSEGTYAGEIGRNDNTYKYVNNINLIKVGDGTFTFSGLPYYFGETNIEDGVLKFVNDNASGNKNFTSSSALKGSGTFEIVGNTNNWVVFALNADASVAQEFSGLMDVSGYMVFNKDTNLGNATLHVAENSIVSMNGGSTKNLTVNELNTEAGSRVRNSHASPGEGNFATLTVGSGTVNGDLGETAANAWYNWVKLNKVSDGTDDGGTLTLAGAFLYTGETTVSGGTLQLTGNAVSANAKMTVEDNGTLEYNVAEDQTKKLTISEQNAIYSTGQIVKTGEGTLQLEAAANFIDAKSLELVEGRLDLKGSMKGDLLVNGGVFSPGNSFGEANVTGNVTITDDGAILFEFSSYDEGLFDVLNIVNGTTENAFTAGDNTIQLLFETGDEADWAAALVDNPDGYQLVSDNNFASLGNLSDWLSTNKDLFGLEGRTDGLYLVAASGPEPGSGVPEPSTWALLILGIAGLLYVRKRKN